jgi:hypothetical protein
VKPNYHLRAAAALADVPSIPDALTKRIDQLPPEDEATANAAIAAAMEALRQRRKQREPDEVMPQEISVRYVAKAVVWESR